MPYNKPTVKHPVYLDHKYVRVHGACTYGNVHTHTYIYIQHFHQGKCKITLAKE